MSRCPREPVSGARTRTPSADAPGRRAPGTRRRVAVALAAISIAAVVVLALAGKPGDLYRDSDYMQYYAGSRALLEGTSPYDHAWWADFHRRVGSEALSAPPRSGDPMVDWTTPYPLPTFVALLPFALFPLGVAEPLFLVTQAALVAAATLALGAVLLPSPRRDAPLVLAIVGSSQPLWVLIAGGNISGFPAALFALALAATIRGRPATAGALLAGTLLKPHLFVVGALALLVGTPASGRPRLVLAGLAAAAALVVPAFVLEPGWVGAWSHEASLLQDTSASNATGWTIARPLVADFRPWSAVLTLLCVAGLGVWWWRSRPAVGRLVAAAMPVSVLLAPHGWSYDYIALLPTAVAGVALAASARARTVALAVVALVAVAVPWALYSVAFQRNGEDLSAWLLIAATAALVGARTVSPSRP